MVTLLALANAVTWTARGQSGRANPMGNSHGMQCN